MTLKQQIHHHFLQVINERIALYQQVLADLKESGANETKSTAGDKHETALAMLQIEQANTRSQLNDVFAKKALLEKINPALSASIILNGSLIKTNHGYLYLSIALGKAIIDEVVVVAISPQSPLGQILIGLTVGDEAKINSHLYKIENIS
jgi:hypothetical protein